MSRPLNGAKRKSRPHRFKGSIPPLPIAPNDPRYRLQDVAQAPRFNHQPGTIKLPRKLRDRALFAGPGGSLFTQVPYLPTLPGRVGVMHALEDPSHSTIAQDAFAFAGDGDDNAWNDDWGMHLDEVEEARHVRGGEKKGQHRARRESQFFRWKTDILPSLIPVYLEIQRETRSGRYALSQDSYNVDTLPSCTCGRPVVLRVILARWDRTSSHLIVLSISLPPSRLHERHS